MRIKHNSSAPALPGRKRIFGGILLLAHTERRGAGLCLLLKRLGSYSGQIKRPVYTAYRHNIIRKLPYYINQRRYAYALFDSTVRQRHFPAFVPCHPVAYRLVKQPVYDKLGFIVFFRGNLPEISYRLIYSGIGVTVKNNRCSHIGKACNKPVNKRLIFFGRTVDRLS